MEKTMKRSTLLPVILLAVISLAVQPPLARAGISYTGDIDPADPNTWTSSTTGYVGKTANGTLTVDYDSDLLSKGGYIGTNSSGTGTVTVNGAGSTWTNSSVLHVGRYGNGTLNITNGGTVSNTIGFIGEYYGSTGVVTVDGADSTWANNWDLYVGNKGNGTLTITGGGVVGNIHNGIIGRYPGATGQVTVDGANSTWTNNSNLYVGSKGNGTLTITDGGVVSNNYVGYIGYSSGATGEVTVDGVDSMWTNGSNLHVGSGGSGTLNIAHGATVSVAGYTSVPYNTDSTSTINFGPGGGTLNTSSIKASSTQLTGTGTINARGVVSDIDLVFDSTHGLNRTLTFDSQPGQNVTINLDMSGSSGSVGDLGVGYQGNGSLNIRDGITVNSQSGYLGYYSGSTGVATVDGAGSIWNNSGSLNVGLFGNGELNITGGAYVSSSATHIDGSFGSIGLLNVDGANSEMNNRAQFVIGIGGNGKMNITNGATVSNSTGSIGNNQGANGVVVVDGSGSTWNSKFLNVGELGNGTLIIRRGGLVSSDTGSNACGIGASLSSTGEVTVDGFTSKWINTGQLAIGYSGKGTLNIVTV